MFKLSSCVENLTNKEQREDGVRRGKKMRKKGSIIQQLSQASIPGIGVCLNSPPVEISTFAELHQGKKLKVKGSLLRYPYPYPRHVEVSSYYVS